MMFLHRSILILVMLSLSACGFHLRGSDNLPPLMAKVLVEGSDSPRELLREFEYLLLRNGAQIASSRAEASMLLQLDRYETKSRVVAMDSKGYAREKELTISLTYTVLNSQRQVLLSPRQLQLHGDVLVDKDNVIASERAEKDTYRQLQQRMAATLLNVLRYDLRDLSGEAVNETGQ